MRSGVDDTYQLQYERTHANNRTDLVLFGYNVYEVLLLCLVSAATSRKAKAKLTLEAPTKATASSDKDCDK